MIIDFHTHIFPDGIAARAVRKLSLSANIRNYADGTHAGLLTSMEQSPVDYSVIMPVATKPSQTADINRITIETNEWTHDTHLISFGGIHPDNDNYREVIRDLAAHHVPGIKLHPVFTNTYIDDIRHERIIDCASEYGLMVLTHAGYDISSPTLDYVTPAHIKKMLSDVKPPKMILAHMGSWGCWDEVMELLIDEPVYFDTAFCINPLRCSTYEGHSETLSDVALSTEQFLRLVRAHGAQRILFGTDSPWSMQAESVTLLQNSGLSGDELSLILGENAKKLLQLPA